MKKNLLLLFLCPMMAMAQFQSFPLEDAMPEGAFCYCLPRTALDLTVESKVIVEKPGAYARYAERYLGIHEVITEESVRHELIGVKISTATLPDAAKRFYIPYKKVSLSDSLNIRITPEGILQSINMSDSPHPWGKRAMPANFGRHQDSRIQRPMREERNEDASSAYALTGEMIQANSTAREAELAAKQIFSLRETRLALLQGELDNMPQDGASMRLYLEELNRMEKAYTEMFTGSRREKNQYDAVRYIPEEVPCFDVAFRFSSEQGVLDKEDLSGSPIHVKAEILDDCHFIQPSENNEEDFGKKKEKEKAVGLYYYLPHLSHVWVQNGRQILCEEDIQIAQGGDLMKLPSNRSIRVELDVRTGAIVRKSGN